MIMLLRGALDVKSQLPMSEHGVYMLSHHPLGLAEVVHPLSPARSHFELDQKIQLDIAPRLVLLCYKR